MLVAFRNPGLLHNPRLQRTPCGRHEPLVVMADKEHSKKESRYLALGQTDAGRRLFISFTVRRSFIRAISARNLTRTEVRTYEQSKK